MDLNVLLFRGLRKELFLGFSIVISTESESAEKPALIENRSRENSSFNEIVQGILIKVIMEKMISITSIEASTMLSMKSKRNLIKEVIHGRHSLIQMYVKINITNNTI